MKKRGFGEMVRDNMICIRYIGKTKRSGKGELRPVVCYVSYGDEKKHLKIVESEFESQQGLDLDYMRKNHPSHFSDPHNVARAILRHKYFGGRGLWFRDENWASMSEGELPRRPADAEGEDFKLWVDFPEGSPTR